MRETESSEPTGRRDLRILRLGDFAIAMVAIALLGGVAATTLRPALYNAAATAALLSDDPATAERYLWRAVVTGRRFGAHDSVATALDRLVALYSDQARHEEAEVTLMDLLALREAHLGNEHPAVAEVLEDLGIVAKQQGRREDAEGWFRRSLTVREASLGARHPQTASAFLQLGSLYRVQGEIRRADLYLTRARSILEDRVPGDAEPTLFRPVPGRPDAFATERLLLTAALYELSAVRTLQHQFHEALQLATLVRDRAHEGRLSPALEVAALAHLGAIHQAQGETTAAMECYTDARVLVQQHGLEGSSLEASLLRNVALGEVTLAGDAGAARRAMRAHLAQHGALAISVSRNAALSDGPRQAL